MAQREREEREDFNGQYDSTVSTASTGTLGFKEPEPASGFQGLGFESSETKTQHPNPYKLTFFPLAAVGRNPTHYTLARDPK